MGVKKPVFKAYHQTQIMLLPPNLDELIPNNHPSRVVNDIIDRIDILPLYNAYKGEGASSYHPKMLLKVLVYGYISNVYSSRKLEQSCRENISYMWLSGMSKPDHNTINRFRGVRLKDALKYIFSQIVILLADEGLLSIEEVNTDGTKIEANANKYTFVWKKSIENNKERMKKQLSEIWNYAQSISTGEDNMPEPLDFTEISKEKVLQTVDKLNEVLKENPKADQKAKAKLRYITQHFVPNIVKYEHQEAILGERNSYSKTDNDATFMRMKEDHMKNGQLKPGYNIQISTSNQFVVNYSVHSSPTDTTTLIQHLNEHKNSYNLLPKDLVADAGYGSEENFTFLAENNINAYVKYGMFDKQQSTKYLKKNPFAATTLYYNEEKDCYICPMGQEMNFIGNKKQKTTTGFEQNLKRYEAKNCTDCPLNGKCHKSKNNRIIEVNPSLNKHRQKSFELLNSEKGIEKRKKRCYDVEPVFGNIKNNQNFKRFLLRGKEKVAIEWGLLAIAQNLRKKSA
jgi:transposase